MSHFQLSVLLVGSSLFASWAQQLFLFNISEPINGLSSTCIAVLNQPLACDPALLDAAGKYLSDGALTSICSSACQSSWSTYLRRVNGACGTSRYDGGNGYLYLPGFDIEPVYEQYQLLCLKNTAGKLCNAVIRDIMHVDPDTQAVSSGAPAPDPTAACDGCFMSSFVQLLEMPLSSASEYATALTALETSCQSTLTWTSPAVTSWAIPASTTSQVPACQGTQYAIQASDTCQSIATAQGFSTTQLLAANNLPAYCRNFPASGTICLPDALKCKAYSPKTDESCHSIAAKNGISFAQLVAWNPEVGRFCGSIPVLIAKNMVICVSNPGGNWMDPYPVSTTSASSTDTIFTQTPTPMSQFTATVSPVSTLLPNENYVIPFANDTRVDCTNYATPPVLVDATNRTYSYACSDMAAAYGVSVSNFLAWNPAINQTGGILTPCELSGLAQYCVQLLADIPADTALNCSYLALAKPSWSCDRYAAVYNITRAAVVAWNPSVGAACSNFTTGRTYCAAVQHYKSPDTIPTCSYWVMANASLSTTCSTLEATYKLDHNRFVAWNPSVLPDCSGAVNGYDYCVGTPAFHPGFPS